MSLACITYPFVGIRGLCASDAPSSGLYVDDVAGITVKKFANIADDIASTAEKKYILLHQEAVRRVESDVYSLLLEVFHKNHIIDSDIKGSISNDYSKESLTGEYGVKIKKTNYDPYTKLRLDYIEFKSGLDVDSQKFIVTDGCTKKAVCVSLKAGCTQKVYFDFITNECEIMVYTDMTDLTITKRKYNSCSCEYLECDQYNGQCSCRSCFRMYGVKNESGLWVSNGTNNGMVVSASCVCDAEILLCRLKSELAIAVKYMIANLLMEEVLLTERQNPLVRNSKEDAELIIAKLMGGNHPRTGFELKSKLYYKEIEKVVESAKRIIKLEKSSCFSCSKKTMKKVTALP